MKEMLIDIDMSDGGAKLKDKTAALIPELHEVYKDKKLGSRAVRWIVMMYDYNSPYMKIPDEDRRERTVTQDLYGKKSHYILTGNNKRAEKVQKAAEKYKELQYDPLIDQYFAFRKKYKEFNRYIKDWDVAKSSDDEKKMKRFLKIMEQIREIRNELERVKSEILKEKKGEKVRGGGDLSWLEKQQRQ